MVVCWGFFGGCCGEVFLLVLVVLVFVLFFSNLTVTQ